MQPKKSLGQNFISNRRILALMINAAKIIPGDQVLEVGPGGGLLTSMLLDAGAIVVSVEKDETLISPLQGKFQNQIKAGQLRLLKGDILEFAPGDFFSHHTNFKIVANIPYYITGVFLKRILSSDWQPVLMMLMLQKEVAERIVARDGKESLLSLGVKVYGEPRYLKTIRRGNFRPVPKVDSAIISIENISRKNFADRDHEKNFFNLAKRAFGQKRKMVINTLGVSSEDLRDCGILPTARPEKLRVGDWLRLSRIDQ